MKNTVLITGASSGIGAALAREFAINGHDLVLIARNTNRLETISSELRSQYGVLAKVIVRDLADRNSAEAIYRQLQNEKISIQILINNAGFNVYGEFIRTSLESELQLIEVMIASTTRLTKLFVKDMVTQGRGKVLNVCYTGSFAPGPLDAVYQASKAYMLSFSEALHEELRGTGITVTALCPGATETEFAQRANMSDTRLFKGMTMSAESVAKIGLKAAMKGKRSVVAGFLNRLLVLSIRFLPKGTLLRTTRLLLSKN
ncbi:MAG: SDR family oxidoreductase [Spirochaetota bacterium]